MEKVEVCQETAVYELNVPAINLSDESRRTAPQGLSASSLLCLPQKSPISEPGPNIGMVD